MSSHTRKVSGWGQPSLKHSFGWFKPSSECSIFPLLELVGLRGTAWHKITQGRNRSNHSKANACENCRRGGFAPHFCASKQARVAFPTRAHLCFVGHHSVVTHEPPITVWMTLINQISKYHFKIQKRDIKINNSIWFHVEEAVSLVAKYFFLRFLIQAIQNKKENIQTVITRAKQKGKCSNCYKQKLGEKLVLSLKGLCFH